MLVHILDNFLPDKLQEQIEYTMFGFQFAWFHYANTSNTSHVTQPGDSPQFTHGFMRDGQNNSKFTQIPLEILKPFGWGFDDMLRAKANLQVWSKERSVGPSHIDDENPHYVLIYYVQDSDGDTCLFENNQIVRRIAPKRGQALFFDGSIYHASSTPVDHRYRAVVNINLKSTIDPATFAKHKPG